MEQHLFNVHFGGSSIPNPLEEQRPEPEPELEPFGKFEKDGKTHFHCNAPNCGKIFKFKSEMTRHLVIHFENRPYACPYEGCTKAFKRSDALDNHVRIHTKEMPYVCDVPGCGFKFTTKSGLRYHLMKHSEQKLSEPVTPANDRTFMMPVQSQLQEKITYIPQTICKRREPEQAVSSSKKDQFNLGDGYNNDFFNPTPRPAKVMEWQVRNQEEAEKFADVKVADDYERIMKFIIQENKMLKQKLEACTKNVDEFEESYGMKKEFINQAPVLASEPSFLMDENETKFLEFLKGNDSFDF